MNFILFVVSAYVIGSLSFAVMISRLMRIPDPRQYGSHNPGATNVLRGGHKVAALLTFVGDGAKGWVVMWGVQALGAQYDVIGYSVGYVMLAVFMGHCWPIFLRFHGGKGVATALGILLGVNVWLGLATLGTWLVIAYAFRYSSLSALISALFAPFYDALLFGTRHDILWAIVLMSVILIARHKNNIRNLLSGQETRIGHQK